MVESTWGARRRLEPDELLCLRNRLALGLAAAHEMDIVHWDVSLENVLLPEGSIDRAKLIDFGIALLYFGELFPSATICCRGTLAVLIGVTSMIALTIGSCVRARSCRSP
jgi:serine/threonine protein kinase